MNLFVFFLPSTISKSLNSYNFSPASLVVTLEDITSANVSKEYVTPPTEVVNWLPDGNSTVVGAVPEPLYFNVKLILALGAATEDGTYPTNLA